MKRASYVVRVQGSRSFRRSACATTSVARFAVTTSAFARFRLNSECPAPSTGCTYKAYTDKKTTVRVLKNVTLICPFFSDMRKPFKYEHLKCY